MAKKTGDKNWWARISSDRVLCFCNDQQESPPTWSQEAYRLRHSLSTKGGGVTPFPLQGEYLMYVLSEGYPLFCPGVPLPPATGLTWPGGGGVASWLMPDWRVPPSPREGPGTGGVAPCLWTDTHVWKHYLSVVLRTRAAIYILYQL